MALSQPPDDGGSTEAGGGIATSTSPTTARALAVKLTAGTKTIVAAKVRDASNVSQFIKEGWVRSTTGLKQFFSPLAVTISSITANGARTSTITVTVTTAAVTVTVTGGSPPYTYLWTRTDTPTHAWTITNPSARTTTFSTLVASHSSQVATFICTITDAAGTVVTSDVVTATASNG